MVNSDSRLRNGAHPWAPTEENRGNNHPTTILATIRCKEARQEAPIRYALRIVSILLIGMGIVWILQGVNILPGSFMTGQIVWAWRGAGIAILGGFLFWIARRMR